MEKISFGFTAMGYQVTILIEDGMVKVDLAHYETWNRIMANAGEGEEVVTPLRKRSWGLVTLTTIVSDDPKVDGRLCFIDFPLWPVLVLFLILPVYHFLFCPIRGRLRVRRGLCRGCAFDLRGTVEPRCPECGVPFTK